MTSNELFILLLGIAILVIFLLILVFAKGNVLFILAVAAIGIGLILIGICLYLMNDLLSRVDDRTKSVGTDIGLLKESVKYLGNDTNGAGAIIDQFIEAISGTKELNTSEIKIYKPENFDKEVFKLDELNKTVDESEPLILEIKEDQVEDFEEWDISNLKPVPKDNINLEGTNISSKVLTGAMNRLIEKLRQQNTAVTQVTNAVTQVQSTVTNAVTAVTENVVNAIQNDTTVQQSIFNSPTVQQTIAQSTTIVQAITNSAPIQNIINNGGNVDLAPLQQAVQAANVNIDAVTANVTAMNAVVNASKVDLQAIITNVNIVDDYLKFVDQSIRFVDQNGNPISTYDGIISNIVNV
jgi:hypothetical protein